MSYGFWGAVCAIFCILFMVVKPSPALEELSFDEIYSSIFSFDGPRCERYADRSFRKDIKSNATSKIVAFSRRFASWSCGCENTRKVSWAISWTEKCNWWNQEFRPDGSSSRSAHNLPWEISLCFSSSYFEPFHRGVIFGKLLLRIPFRFDFRVHFRRPEFSEVSIKNCIVTTSRSKVANCCNALRKKLKFRAMLPCQ